MGETVVMDPRRTAPMRYERHVSSVIERQAKILEAIVNHARMEVSELAEALGVSQVTIRKDLGDLQDQGLVTRERGAVILASADDPASRIAYHYSDKLRIARAAASSVHYGETVMIEAGSCCALLAEEVVRSTSGVTIITNSAFIAHRIRKNNAHTVLLGGTYQNDAHVMVGPLTELCVQQFMVKQLFIGTDGYTPQLGFTGRDAMRAAAVKAMARRAENVAVITESEKFGSYGPVPLLGDDDVTAVWTDAALDEEYRESLQQAGITLHTVATAG